MEEEKISKNLDHLTHGVNWLLDKGIVENDAVAGNAIILCYMCSKRIRDVELVIDPQNKKMTVKLSLSKFWLYFLPKKKLTDKLHDVLSPIKNYYNLSFEFLIYNRK